MKLVAFGKKYSATMPFYTCSSLSSFHTDFLRFSLSWFAKYFDEISAGIDQLVDKPGSDIILSPELAHIETKLNKIKGTLERTKMGCAGSGATQE